MRRLNLSENNVVKWNMWPGIRAEKWPVVTNQKHFSVRGGAQIAEGGVGEWMEKGPKRTCYRPPASHAVKMFSWGARSFNWEFTTGLLCEPFNHTVLWVAAWELPGIKAVPVRASSSSSARTQSSFFSSLFPPSHFFFQAKSKVWEEKINTKRLYKPMMGREKNCLFFISHWTKWGKPVYLQHKPYSHFGRGGRKP